MESPIPKKQKAPGKTETLLQKYIADFLEYCEIGKNQSQHTIAAYFRYLKRFGEFASELGIKSPKDINLELIKKYRLFLNRYTPTVASGPAYGHDRGLKLITQNYHLIALRAFLKYLTKQDIVTLSPEKIELPKNPERQVEFLESSELKRLFDATKQEKDETARLRDYAILQTLFSTGLRVSELASLKRDMVNLERREFTVRGKGSKLRLVFLSDEAAETIKKYLAKRKDNSKALFVSHSTVGNKVEKEIESQGFKLKKKDDDLKSKVQGLTPRSIQRIVKKY